MLDARSAVVVDALLESVQNFVQFFVVQRICGNEGVGIDSYKKFTLYRRLEGGKRRERKK